jgi:hypothetical protein
MPDLIVGRDGLHVRMAEPMNYFIVDIAPSIFDTARGPEPRNYRAHHRCILGWVGLAHDAQRVVPGQDVKNLQAEFPGCLADACTLMLNALLLVVPPV